jgi:predicted MPP superfamily phosphohydrolase
MTEEASHLEVPTPSPGAAPEAQHIVDSGGGEPVRLVHLTDLHYGFGFNDELWNHVEAIVADLQPHVIFVTGDLVNSPWWWRCRRVRAMLDKLKTKTASVKQKRSPLLYVIPGNHDTRVQGILPVGQITPLVLTLSVVVWAGAYVHGWQTWQWVVPIAVTLIVCRYALLRKFTHFFSDSIPALPLTLSDLSLVVYPFDSATHATSGATGQIPVQQFVSARKEADETSDAPYRIALVHHHTVPIPYDSEQESLMVLKNAGAFLSEIAGRGVRLVLSGHKHHQHISRVSINAETPDELEVTVLNTGTPTARRHPSRFGYNFSVIEIHPCSGAKIKQYRSDGGPFNLRPPEFWAENVDRTVKALFRENAIRRKES